MLTYYTPVFALLLGLTLIIAFGRVSRSCCSSSPPSGLRALCLLWLPAALFFAAGTVATAYEAPPEQSPGGAGRCKSPG